MNPEILKYYREPGRHSQAFNYSAALKAAPSDIPELAAWVQGQMIHEHWAARYGEELGADRRAQAHVRSIDSILDAIASSAPIDIGSARPPAGRAVGVCSHFSLVAVSVLRAHGIPARSRCGFGTYFMADKAVDHWVVEVWDNDRWRMVDFQIDEFQRTELGLTFDTLDLPPGQFLLAAEAWQRCRMGKDDPNRFGIFDEGGYWFIASNMIRDLASLNKVELLPWDDYGAMPTPDAEISADQMASFDHLAEVLMQPDVMRDDLLSLYKTPGFTMPGKVFNAVRQIEEMVT